MAFSRRSQQQQLTSNGQRLSTSGLSLEAALDWSALMLSMREDNEQDLAPEEVTAALKVYKELHRILKLSTRTDDTFSRPLKPEDSTIAPTSFHDTFLELKEEIKEARPLTKDNLAEVNDLFILDNSLRETTVGSVRGHTLEEKHQIVDAIADTGLEEIILGAFGSKISVDSQIAGRWTALGKSFDNAWGFSEAFDLGGFDEEPLWNSADEYIKAKREGTELPDYWAPTQEVKTTYSDEDLVLFKRAFAHFPEPNVFSDRKPEDVLKESESPKGRIPMGLLMMAGYGICNAIIEVDTAVETFDYETFDLVERCTYLMQWCKDHFPKRQNVYEWEDNTARVLINCRDFVNYQRSDSGLEMCLHMVDQLCRLPSPPLGFLVEDPTGWLWPDEVGRLTRMIKLTMQRAGHPDGKFLVHLHMYFALAEACVLSSICNGADGVWAALCRTGAQVGHASSTTTAVNLYRAGVTSVAHKYNLAKMCEAARKITAITTKQECPEYEEVYGIHAFDTAFFMYTVPSCRYAVAELMTELNIDERFIRLNEISLVSAIERAMAYHFGKPEDAGWDPKYCPQMWEAIVNHLVTGISRDYNSPLGLGTLYGVVTNKVLPRSMIKTMLQSTKVSDSHPTVIEYVHRWNRLCAKHLGEDYTSPVCSSKSVMMAGMNVELQPRLSSLPFDVVDDDITLSHVAEVIPLWMRKALSKELKVTQQKFQMTLSPVVEFEERLLALKLFIQEANSLQVLPLVDDFILRQRFANFFGDSDGWVSHVRGDRPKKLSKEMIRAGAIAFTTGGNHAWTRMMRSGFQRLHHNVGLREDMQRVRDSIDIQKLIEVTDATKDPMTRQRLLNEFLDEFDARSRSSLNGSEPSDMNDMPLPVDGQIPLGEGGEGKHSSFSLADAVNAVEC